MHTFSAGFSIHVCGILYIAKIASTSYTENINKVSIGVNL